MTRRSDGISLAEAKLGPRKCQGEEKWQRERGVRLGKKRHALLSTHKGSNKPFCWTPFVIPKCSNTNLHPPTKRKLGGKKRLLGQLDSIFKASTWTFEFKVTLTRLGAAVGMQLRGFNAANAFSWFLLNNSDQKKSESYLCRAQKLLLASTFQPLSLYEFPSVCVCGAMGAETGNLCWHSEEWCGNEWLSHPGDAPSCSLRLIRRGGTKRRESGEPR